MAGVCVAPVGKSSLTIISFHIKYLRFHTVTYRDLGRNPVPFVDESWIAAAFTPPERRSPELWEAIRLSDRLVDEFLAADVYVIGVPMYNFSVPATFKAYIDQIVRVGRTVTFEPGDSVNVFQPLVLGKKMFAIEARGDSGFQPGGRYEKMNHHDRMALR